MKTSAIRWVFPKEAFFVFFYVDLVLLLMPPLHFRTPSQIKGWWRTYLKKSLWCRHCSVESLDCTTRKWHVTRGQTPLCALDSTLCSRASADDLPFPTGTLQHLLVSFIIVAPRARPSGNIVVTHFTNWNRQCDQDDLLLTLAGRDRC